MIHLYHKYAPIIFIPAVAIYSNIDFIMDNDADHAITVDNVDCAITYRKEIHICSDEAKQLVRELYDMEIWAFVKKWYSVCDNMHSMCFFKIELKKKK